MNQLEALESAIRSVGGIRRLAAKLGASDKAVWQWKRRGVPAEYCIAIEHASGGTVSRYDLRPDVFREDAALARLRDRVAA